MHPAAYLVAAVAPLLVLVLLLAPIGVLRTWVRSAPVAATTPPPPEPDATEGRPGVGDPYYPRAGNSGYDVAKYTIAISWDPGAETLTGTTSFSARAAHQLRSFYLDLALAPQAVSVDGVPAEFEREGFSDVRVRPARALAAAADFVVTVRYAGRPRDLRQGDVQPWWTTGQEWTAAGEPESSAWWFPANDHPSDPALMEVSVRVPAGMEAISVGRLESRDTGQEEGWDTWHWIARQPMATYLNFVSIGQYDLRQGTEDGLPYVYAVSQQLSPDQRRAAFGQLMTSGARLRELAALFGPYPFTELGGVVPAHQLWFGGLETQTRPVYNAASLLDADFAPQLVVHELAHMWFGDHVTLRQWNDIATNEGYASWAEWAVRERAGGRSAQESLLRSYDRLADRASFWRVPLDDPGRDHLFDTVYVRGPMMLQALRNVIGDRAFSTLSRGWAQDPGSRTLEDWMARAQASTSVDLGPFFRAWVSARTAPARTAANGLA